MLIFPIGFNKPSGGGGGSGVTFTDELSDGAGTPVAITTSLATQAVWQRGRSTLTLAGTYDVTGGTPSSMAWRVGSGDWVALTSETIGSGNWTGTLDIPASYLAQGDLEVKPVNGLNITPATHTRVTVSDIVVLMGQSNVIGSTDVSRTYSGTNYDFLFGQPNIAVQTTALDSFIPDLANELDAAGIPPVVFIAEAAPGTGFLGGNWNPGDGSYNSAVSAMTSRLNLSGGFACIGWIQGEQDAGFLASGQDWDDNWQAMYDQMLLDETRLVGIPWYVTMLGELNGSNAGLDAVRTGVLNLVANNANVYHGPNLLNENWGDGTHYGSVQGDVDATEAGAQLARVGKYHKRAYNLTASGDTDAAPAVVTSAVVTDKVTVTVTFDRAMQNHTDPQGWEITDASGDADILSSAQGATADTVALTTIRNLTGATTVNFGRFFEAIYSTFTDTYSLVSYPPQYTIAEAAGTAPGTGAFRPSDIASATHWWHVGAGKTLTAANGLEVWDDLIAGQDLVPAGLSSQPTYAVRQLNGIDILDFDGTGEYLTTSGTALPEFPTFSLRSGDATKFRGYLWTNSGEFTNTYASDVARHGPALWEVAFDPTANTATVYVDGVQIIQATDYSGTAEGHIFGVVDVDGSGNSSDALFTHFSTVNGLEIGALGAQRGDFGAAEIVTFSSVLTGTDLTDVRGWLNTAWGL